MVATADTEVMAVATEAKVPTAKLPTRTETKIEIFELFIHLYVYISCALDLCHFV